MRRELLALTAVCLVIVSVAAGYLAGTPTSRSVTTTAMPITLPSGVCTTRIPRINETDTTEDYQISPYSIGVICVRYEFQGNGSYSFSPTDYGPQIDSTGSPWIACGSKDGSAVPSVCSGLSITPYQPSINHLSSQNITIAYTIVSGDNTGNLFWFWIGDCVAIPLSIGFTPIWAIPPGFGCVRILGAPTSVTVTGTWNINVTEVSASRPLP